MSNQDLQQKLTAAEERIALLEAYSQELVEHIARGTKLYQAAIDECRKQCERVTQYEAALIYYAYLVAKP